MLYGHGAGMMPTASAVISDTVDIARNLICGSAGRVPLLSYQSDHIRQIPILPIGEVNTQYYFRLFVLDQPGVLSSISGILGNNGISIKSVQQKGRKAGEAVPIVMLTHTAKESSMKKAVSEIRRLDVVSGDPLMIRIEDENDEG
jgi:homoserine dehydrogenase